MLAGALVIGTFALRVQGRLWICACGYVSFWCGDINSPGNSQHLFDPYTFTHILHGFLFFGFVCLLWPRLDGYWKTAATLALETLWEVIENSTFIIERYRSQTISLGYTGDTIVNSFGDLIACAVGVIVARWLGVAKTVILAIAIELVLLATVRDNLLLNIIMLFYPSEAIRAWQSGQ